MEIISETHQELSWLMEAVEEARSWPEGQMPKLMIINAEKAKRLMDTNEDNRGLKRAVIEKISRDIINNRYYLNGETIVISRTGKLLNGQHRLNSIIDTGTPIQTWVIFGVPDEYKTTFDQGTAKSAADFLKMMRVTSAKDVSLTVKLLLIYKPGLEVTEKDSASRRISKQDILIAYEQFEKPIQYAIKTFGQTKYAKNMRAIAPISVGHVLISREVPESIVDTFFDTLTGTGGNIENLNPILWARDKFSELLNSRSKIETSSEYKLNVLLKTWNAWLAKKKVSRLRMDLIFPRITRVDQVDLFDFPKENED